VSSPSRHQQPAVLLRPASSERRELNSSPQPPWRPPPWRSLPTGEQSGSSSPPLLLPQASSALPYASTDLLCPRSSSHTAARRELPPLPWHPPPWAPLLGVCPGPSIPFPPAPPSCPLCSAPLPGIHGTGVAPLPPSSLSMVPRSQPASSAPHGARAPCPRRSPPPFRIADHGSRCCHERHGRAPYFPCSLLHKSSEVPSPDQLPGLASFSISGAGHSLHRMMYPPRSTSAGMQRAPSICTAPAIIVSQHVGAELR
jgi:hypothetical protein